MENIIEKLKKIQHRCTARTIAPEQIFEALKSYAENLKIAKKALIGSIVTDCDLNAQSFPSAYKYTPESTHFSAVFERFGWVLIDVWRAKTNSPTKRFVVKLSDTAKQALIKRFETAN